MYRYCALIWIVENAEAAETVRHLARRLDGHFAGRNQELNRPGLLVRWATDNGASFEAYESEDAPVLALGKLFHKEMDPDCPPRSVSLDKQATQDIILSRGRSLLRRYWGGYVAFVHDERSRSTFVVRDPSGNTPCYLTKWRGVTVVFSHIDDCVALGLPEFSINWDFVAEFLVCAYMQVRDTGIQGVSVLAPGECVELRGGDETGREQYWDIAAIAAGDPIEDVQTAVAMARHTIRACVGAWVAGRPSIVHRLSGGLDSSVVLAALMRAPSNAEVVCVNHFDLNAGADERAYARMAVKAMIEKTGRSCELIEYERRAADVRLDWLSQVIRSVTPERYLGVVSERHMGARNASEGSCVNFTGSGGDAVFFRFRDHSPAIDYVFRHGIGKDLLRVAFEAAQPEGTFFGVLAHAIRDGLFRRDRSYPRPRVQQSLIVNPDVIRLGMSRVESRSISRASHLSSGAARMLSPEKCRHLDIMSQPWKITDPFQQLGEWEWIAPLGSQPVVELFARMPLYVLTARAQDRSIARRAFAPDLPAEIMNRRTKSLMDRYITAKLRIHESFFRETLLDGILVKERILDRTRVEAAFADLSNDSAYISFKDLSGPAFNLEIWLRSWLHEGQQISWTVAASHARIA